MANTTTKAERERIVNLADAMLPEVDTPQYRDDVVTALVRMEGIGRERARSYVAKAIRLRRGEQVRQREYIRRGVNLDPDSLDHIAAIEAATGINGASAVVREALRRMAESL